VVTLTEKKMLDAGILEEFWPLSLDSYSGSAEVKSTIVEYIVCMKNARKLGISLFLFGMNGTGKTLLGVEVLKEALRKSYSAQFTSLGGIIQALTAGWYSDEKRRLFETRIRNVDFLMIDDVGKELRVNKSGLTEVVFDQLIRYRSFRNKPMILSSNSDINAIGNVYGMSLVSLLYGKFIPLKVVGEDYRKNNLSGTVLDRLRGKA